MLSLRTLALAALLSGCGTLFADGPCEDYEPLDFCGNDMQYVCETTRGGCRQCSCVPLGDAEWSPGAPRR